MYSGCWSELVDGEMQETDRDRNLLCSDLELGDFLFSLLEFLDLDCCDRFPFLDNRFSLGVCVGSLLNWSSSRTFFLISSFNEGTGLSEFVGVCVLEALREDFLVNGDWSILCFQFNNLFIDSSLPTASPFFLLSSDSPLSVLLI